MVKATVKKSKNENILYQEKLLPQDVYKKLQFFSYPSHCLCQKTKQHFFNTAFSEFFWWSFEKPHSCICSKMFMYFIHKIEKMVHHFLKNTMLWTLLDCMIVFFSMLYMSRLLNLSYISTLPKLLYTNIYNY